MDPTIYKPSIYKGAGIYKAGAEGGGGPVIPDEYFQLEYLETTAAASFLCAVPTPFNNDNEINIVLEFQYQNSQTILYMKNTDTILDSNSLRVEYENVNCENRFVFRNTNLVSYVSNIVSLNNLTNKSKYTIKKDLLTVENSLGDKFNYTTAFYNLFQIKYFNILARGNNNTYPLIGKFFRLWVNDDNGKMLLNLLPVKRKNDAVLGIYDTISGTLFTPTFNPGNIIAGPIVF